MDMKLFDGIVRFFTDNVDYVLLLVTIMMSVLAIFFLQTLFF